MWIVPKIKKAKKHRDKYKIHVERPNLRRLCHFGEWNRRQKTFLDFISFVYR